MNINCTPSLHFRTKGDSEDSKYRYPVFSAVKRGESIVFIRQQETCKSMQKIEKYKKVTELCASAN